MPREEHEGSYLDAMLGSASVQLGVDPSVARYLPNHSLSRVPPPIPPPHHLSAIEHHHVHYGHHVDNDPSTASPSPGIGEDQGLAPDGHHYHVQSLGTHENGVHVTYEQNYASSSNHAVFHHHHAHDETEYHTADSPHHPHSQIDPSLRPHPQHQQTELHDDVAATATVSAHEFEIIPDAEQQVLLQPTQRPKKRRRPKDRANRELSTGKAGKRRKQEAASAIREDDETEQRRQLLAGVRILEDSTDGVGPSEPTEEYECSPHPDLTVHSPDGYLVHT